MIIDETRIPSFLSLEEVSSTLQLSERTLLRMIEQGKIPADCIEGEWRIPEGLFRQWVDQKEAKILSELDA